MSAKECALQDIRQELERSGKCFIAYRRELNPVMKLLVKAQIKAQKNKDKNKK